MKKCITLPLMLMVICSSALADSKGKIGKNVRFILDNEGVMTVSGDGMMKNFGYEFPFREDLVNELIVEEGVENIGDNFMKGAKNLRKVTLPSTISSIGKKAFYNCSDLSILSIPYGVKEILEEAFKNCRSLSRMEIPGSVELIGDKAFENCSSLVFLRLPSSVKSLGKMSFNNTKLLEKINELPDLVTVNNAHVFGLPYNAVKDYYASRNSLMTSVEPYNVFEDEVSSSKEDKKSAKKEAVKSDVDINIPKSSVPNPNTFAVIISNEHYQKLNDVPYALSDGNSFATYCNRTLGIPEKNIFMVKDATLGNMKEIFSDLRLTNRVIGSDINVIVYYAGHGAPDDAGQEAFLLPVDASRVSPDICLSISDVYDMLGNLDVNSVTVFIDACFSGGQRTEEHLFASTGSRAVRRAQPKGTVKGKVVVLTASSGDETALPNDEQGHGLFTYTILKKLQQTGGNITLAELCDYVMETVPSQALYLTRKSQMPTLLISPEVKNDWKTRRLIP